MLFDKNAKREAEDEDKPESKFRDGEYEVKTSIDHEGKRYEPAAPGAKPTMVRLTAKQAEELAGLGAIKV